MRYDTSIFSPDTYHAAILAALKQSAANQDTRYLDMLATMNGMGKKPVPDLQAGIVQHLPGVPFGYNNAHHAPTAEMLLPPPIYQAPVTKVVETNAPPPGPDIQGAAAAVERHP
jgi:hypothetical protein